jgi:hypothetical protein
MKRNLGFTTGQLVLVSHDQGLEVGELFSINYKTGKATIYISSSDCPHYYGVNVSQLQEFKPQLVKS